MTATLTTVEPVRKRGQIKDGSTSRSELVRIALEQATLQLLELLEVDSFDRASYVETFHFHDNSLCPPSNFVPLIPRNGFHFQDAAALPTPIVTEVRMATDLAGVASQDPVVAGELLIDDERGIITALGVESKGVVPSKFFSVSYTAGFTAVNKESEGMVYQAVPQWLQDLCATLAWNRYIDLSGDEYKSGNKKGGLVKLPVDYIQSVIRRKIRRVPGGLDPIPYG